MNYKLFKYFQTNRYCLQIESQPQCSNLTSTALLSFFSDFLRFFAFQCVCFDSWENSQSNKVYALSTFKRTCFRNHANGHLAPSSETECWQFILRNKSDFSTLQDILSYRQFISRDSWEDYCYTVTKALNMNGNYKKPFTSRKQISMIEKRNSPGKSVWKMKVFGSEDS